jgi:DNA-directed RNA polymerase subunit RPC12/RpoP
MHVSFKCTGCSLSISAPETMTGQHINCPKCNLSLRIPTVDPTREFVLNGTRIVWETLTGTAEGVRKETNTRVFGAGGVHKGTGAMHIGSRVERNTEFYIATKRGKEVPYFVDDANLMIRNGHCISAIHAVTRKHEVCVALVNHTTGETCYLESAESAVKSLGALPKPRWKFSIVDFIFLLIAGPFVLLGIVISDNSSSIAGGVMVMLGLGCAAISIVILELRYVVRLQKAVSCFKSVLKEVRHSL